MKARFSGKIVLVAGGTGGLGRAVSLAFLDEGARVVVTYRTQKEFDVLTNAAGEHSSLLEGDKLDVTDEAAVKQLIDRIL
jgi:NAD(P)-dependent dehydrogenase (short-subunit alcohol dehydrogenase family)